MRRSLTEKETAVTEKDRQLQELQRQVADLQAKALGSVGSVVSPPIVPADNRAGVCHVERELLLLLFCKAAASVARQPEFKAHALPYVLLRKQKGYSVACVFCGWPCKEHVTLGSG